MALCSVRLVDSAGLSRWTVLDSESPPFSLGGFGGKNKVSLPSIFQYKATSGNQVKTHLWPQNCPEWVGSLPTLGVVSEGCPGVMQLSSNPLILRSGYLFILVLVLRVGGFSDFTDSDTHTHTPPPLASPKRQQPV